MLYIVNIIDIFGNNEENLVIICKCHKQTVDIYTDLHF